MILALILIGISFIALFCYCCCVVASKAEQEINDRGEN